MSYITLNQSLTALAKSAGAVLYLDARKSTGNGKPINDPLTNPWVDLSGQGNNATPTNMAGTTSSGVDTTDPLKPFWVLDGTDDFFSLVNAANVDVTSAPLGLFMTMRGSSTGTAGFVFCKNLSSSADTQYALFYNPTSQIFQVYMEGAVRKSSATTSVLVDTWYNIGFIWDGTNVKAFINSAQNGANASYSGTLTSRSNVRIGCRGNNGIYFKGSLATLTVYTGAKATEANILKVEKAISKAYIGG